jgi:hypothetical protein
MRFDIETLIRTIARIVALVSFRGGEGRGRRLREGGARFELALTPPDTP